MGRPLAAIVVMLLTGFGVAEIAAGQAEKPHSTTIAGKVRHYEPGKEIAIDVRPQVERTFDLASANCSYHLDPGIQVGTNVTVEESHDDKGAKTLTIQIKR